MSTAIAHDSKAADCKCKMMPFLTRRLHSLTGLAFGGYLVVHLIINATLAQGTKPDVYQEQVNKIHSLPFLMLIEWGLLYMPIIFHTLCGFVIILGGAPNISNYRYTKNLFYVLQRTSALIIVAFILFHVLGMKGALGSTLAFDEHHATSSAARHIRTHWSVGYVIYPLGILASCFHLANGFWTAAITWGLTISKGAQRRFGFVCFGIFLITLFAGLLSLYTLISSQAIVIH